MNRLADIYESQIEKAINEWGRNINVVYGSTSNCSSCAWEPINKEGTNAGCDTCNGQFYFQTENNWKVKGALKTFIGDMKFRDYSLHKFGYVPEFDARITCWLQDVLVVCDSATGKTYLDNPIKVVVDGKDYEVTNTYKTGANDLKVIVAALKEKK